MDLALKSPAVLQRLLPRYIFRAALEITRQSAGIAQAVSAGPDGYAVWNELQNKIEAFSLFEFADSELEITQEAGLPLREIALRALRLNPYRSVWTMEGTGHYYANRQCSANRFPQQLLRGKQTECLPPCSLVPLHTGMGLALAEKLLQSVCNQPLNSAELIDDFADICRDNSREGYAGAVFEGLGLVARNLFPDLVPVINLRLLGNEPLLDYFWHGVGRGLYFNLGNAPPFCSAPWKAMAMCRSEPPHSLGRLNAVAGLAWALTLVNIRQPEVLATFLKYHAADVLQDDAFANGVYSALVVWQEVSPGGQYLEKLQNYVPRYASPGLLDLWEQCVTQSCVKALSYKGMLPKTAISQVFRYQ